MFMNYGLGVLFTILVITFPYLSTPLSMGCCLLLTTISVALNGSLAYTDLWMSYILVLVFLGGVLVIFIYVALVSSNEQFSLTLKPLLPFTLTLPAFFWLKLTYLHNKGTTHWINEVYSENLHMLTLFLVLYLFLTLIVVVFNTKSTKMTLRSF